MNLLRHKLLLTAVAVFYLIVHPYLVPEPISIEKEMFLHFIGFIAMFTSVFITALEQMVIYLKKDKEI